MSCGVQSCGCSTNHRSYVHLDWPNRNVFNYARGGTRRIMFIGHGGANGCGIKGGDTIYTGCNHIYHKHGDAKAQCGHAVAVKFYTEICKKKKSLYTTILIFRNSQNISRQNFKRYEKKISSF